MSNFGRNLALWVIIAVMLVLLFNVFQPGGGQHASQQLAYSDFVGDVNAGRVRSVVIQQHNVTGTLTDGTSFETYLPEDPNLVSRLTDKGVEVVAKPEDSDVNPLLRYLLQWLPMLLLIGAWFFVMRQMQSGGGRAMGFGKSRARMLTEKQGRITFDDVAGIDEAKGELQEVVEFLKDPQKFQRLGGKIPKGVLLIGPPGTGKTLLARAIAGEANVPFFTISGSDFVEMFVGVGASRVRDMFEQGKKSAPCIIFIDEIDAVGRHRGAGLGGGNDEREQTLNQMLVEMDGFESNEGVILIAATNRPDVLDPALLRPGRFDRQVVVPNPDVNGREKILRVHMRKVPLASDVEPKVIARGTPGFSGADLANLVNEAALLAARLGKRTVAMLEFENAKDKVMMGAERRSLVMSEEEKRLTAYHEGGHALCALYEPESDPLHKVTIIPRGRALGVTFSLPENDRLSESRAYLKALLVKIMGGRVAEEIILGPEKITGGAAGDIKQATRVARMMVTELGMSDKLGMIAYGDNSQEVFLGHSVTQNKNVSEVTAREIEAEVKAMIDAGYTRAKEILIDHIEELHMLANGLLEHETLSGIEVRQILRGEKVVRSVVDDPMPDNRRASVPSTGGFRPDPTPPGRAHPERRLRQRLSWRGSGEFAAMSLLLEPMGLLHGPEARQAVSEGMALPLQGGAVAFSLVRLLGRDEQPLVPVARIPAEWHEALHRLTSACGSCMLPAEPLVMGVLNVTPDSFSDAGRYFQPEHATAAGMAMIEAGAAILDLGGESTRPGALAVAAAEEQARILPVLRALRGRGALISVDTRHASTMQAALDAGADLINDVSGLSHDPGSVRTLAAFDCPVVLMHMRGTPETMAGLARYDDVAAEVVRELACRIEHAVREGIHRSRIVIDPGIGFSKNQRHNLELLRRLPVLGNLGCRVLLGTSRKRFIGSVAGIPEPRSRDPGSIVSSLQGLVFPGCILRVHDVAGMVQGLRVWRAVQG